MGRVVSFSIKKEKGKFSKKDKIAMLNISDKYNSGQFEHIWKCENFYIDPIDVYPNWNKFSHGSKDAWDIVNNRIEELKKEGVVDQFELTKILFKEKLVLFSEDQNSNEIRGFTKIQGNEMNALVIYTALLELSELIPNSIIEMSDEGRFLYTDIKIKKGKAQPDFESTRKHIAMYSQRIVMHKSQSFLKQFNTLNLPEPIIREFELDGSPYDVESSIKYTNDKLLDISEVYSRLKDKIKSDYHCLENISGQWFTPELLCRPIKMEDFENIECSAATMMAGFSGTYYGLSNEDEEAESYRHIGFIQKMLAPALEQSGAKLEILNKIKN